MTTLTPFNIFNSSRSSRSKGCRVSLEPISNIKKNLLHLNLPEDKLGLLASKYRGIPEVYYEHDKPITPDIFNDHLGELNREFMFKVSESTVAERFPGSSIASDHGKLLEGRLIWGELWEWMSGSGIFSAVARELHLRVLPPVDYRYGWSLGRRRDQHLLLAGLIVVGVYLLAAAPTCTPWGTSSRAWSEDERQEKRAAEFPALRFLAVACVVQLLLGCHFFIETPSGSQLFEHSPLAVLVGLPGVHLTYFDQCEYGAEIEGVPVLKATKALSSFPLTSCTLRCQRNHKHCELQGRTQGATRTTQASVWPRMLCEALLRDIAHVRDRDGFVISTSSRPSNALDWDFSEKSCDCWGHSASGGLEEGFSKLDFKTFP